MNAAGNVRRPLQVVVVAYHAADLVADCLEALGNGAPVIVVDNSSDSAVAGVAQRYGAEYEDPGTNLGFAAGVNRALRGVIARNNATDVLLLNPDAELAGSDLRRLQEVLVSSPGVGTLTPRLIYASGAEQRVLWPFPSPMRAWAEALGLSRYVRGPQFAVGAALLIRWEALVSVGVFDERYFLYAEESDWQLRAAHLGWRAAVHQDVVAKHVGGATSTDPLRREVLFHAGTETYIRKWFGSRGWFSYRAAVIIGCAVRVILSAPRRGPALTRAGIYMRGPVLLAMRVRRA